MKYLLDTCTFVWYFLEPGALPTRVKECIDTKEADVYLSSVSVAEICLKYSLGKLPLPAEPSFLIPRLCAFNTITALPLEHEDSFLLENLPLHHRDPADRFLICQAMRHHLTILTPDTQIQRYEVSTQWDN